MSTPRNAHKKSSRIKFDNELSRRQSVYQQTLYDTQEQPEEGDGKIERIQSPPYNHTDKKGE